MFSRSTAKLYGAHHVLGIEHLLRQLGNGERAVLLGAAGRQRSEAGHEEVETGERNHVDSDLAQVAVQLTGEAQAASSATHRRGHQMVEITVGLFWTTNGEFEILNARLETDQTC